MGRTLPLALIALLAVVNGRWTLAAPPTSITPNGFGTSVSGSGGYYNITGGTAMGGNLYHSFLNFNLGTGDTADFDVTSNTTNIIARVTGGPSSIDGTITSTIGPGGPISNANLFFLNPAGVMFTANAQVNLGGSFVVSTGNYVKFSDGTIFYSDLNHPIQDAGLTSAPVSAFGFMPGSTPQPVTFNGTQLNNSGGIHVLGGDITLDQGTTLLAPSGNLTLFSAASAGAVPFSLFSPGAGFASATNTAFGNITMQNGSSVAIDSSQSGGSVVIRGGQIVVDNSTISSANSGTTAGGLGGDVAVQASGGLTLSNSSMSSNSYGSSNAGDITINAQSIVLEGSSIMSNSYGTGGTGRINVIAAANLVLDNSAQIATTDTTSNGAGSGNVDVEAGSFSCDDGSIITQSNFGPAGNIQLTVNNGASLQDGASISTTTFLVSNGGAVNVNVAGEFDLTNGGQIFAYRGDISVKAGSIYIDGSGSQVTGIQCSSDNGLLQLHVTGSLDVTSGGAVIGVPLDDSGVVNIDVAAGKLLICGNNSLGYVSDVGAYAPFSASNFNGEGTVNVSLAVIGSAILSNGGSIVTATSSGANAGNIILSAGSLSIGDADNYDYYSAGINSGAENSESTGYGGDINVAITGALNLTNGGNISADSQGLGNAGEISVKCGSLAIDGATTSTTPPATISSTTDSTNGNGGNVNIAVVGSADVINGGTVTAAALEGGNGGNILFTAGKLQIEGRNPVEGSFSGIFSQAGGGGDGEAPSPGAAGGIQVDVAGTLSITEGGAISSDALGNGNAGDIVLHIGQLDVSGYSTFVEAGAYGPILFVEDSSITSQTLFAGNGGTMDLYVTGSASVTNGGQISTNSSGSGNAGVLNLRAGQLTVSGMSVLGNNFAGESASSAPGSGADSSLTSNALGAGYGGTVNIAVSGAVNLAQNGSVDAISYMSNAGNVAVKASSLVLQDGAQIDTSAAMNGGSITLEISNLVYLFGSSITASANQIGGNITIDPEFVVLDDSSISAAGGERNGNIAINADYFLDEDSPVTATGIVNISVPDLDLSGDLLPLPAVLENDEKRLRESCARSVTHEYSSLVVVGRGGTESSPDELQPDFGIDEILTLRPDAPPVR